jgi:hypothetical protein
MKFQIGYNIYIIKNLVTVKPRYSAPPLGGRYILSIFENVIDFNANDVKIHIFWNLHYKIVEKMWLTYQNSLKNG